MSKRIFTANDSWQDWVSLCYEIGTERGEVLEDPDICPMVQWAREMGDITMAEALNGPCMSEYGARAWQWAFRIAHDYLAEELFEPVMKVIALDEFLAAVVYRDFNSCLKPEHKYILWDSFADNMPVMRQRLLKEVGGPDGSSN